jgi:hypothetical protein
MNDHVPDQPEYNRLAQQVAAYRKDLDVEITAHCVTIETLNRRERELAEARADNEQLRRRLIEMQNDKLVRTPEEVVYDQMRRYGLPDPTAMAVARGYQSAFDERVGAFLAYELALKAQVEKNRSVMDRLLAEEVT